MITAEEIEILDRLFLMPIETDEDYCHLAEIFDEDERKLGKRGMTNVRLNEIYSSNFSAK